MSEIRYKLDMAAFEGRTVTQGHSDYCAANGHANLKGQASFCHRCGEATKINNYTVTTSTGRAYVYLTKDFKIDAAGERTICIGRTKREAVSNSTMRSAWASRWVARDRAGKLLGDFYTRKAAVAEIIRYYEWWTTEGQAAGR